MTAIGQAGTISANTTTTGQPITVTFDSSITLTDPVITISGTNFGGNKFSFRVIEVLTDGNGDATGFTFTMDEWENHDGPHPRVEDIYWLAIESGVHTLPDGRIIEAGFADADSDGETVNLNGGFSDPPTVLTTVASDNFASNVDSDPTDVQAGSFTLSVEEAESQDGTHGLENVGYIAIEAGGDGTSGTTQNVGNIDSGWTNNVGYGATYTNPIALVESQTQVEDDTGNVIVRNVDGNNIDIRFEEDTSVDADNHTGQETVGLVTFEAGVILCFTPQSLLQTPYGLRDIGSLAPGDLVLTQDHGPQPITWMAQTTRDPSTDTHTPICIEEDAIAPGVPSRLTWVSPQHRILFAGWKAQLLAGEEEVLIPAKALVNGRTIYADPDGPLGYVHLLLDQHQLIMADGMMSESLHPGEMTRRAFDPAAREELFALFPELRTDNCGYGKTARMTLKLNQARAFAA